MWWGPGLHNTLTMTNNTTGFSHLMVGTLREKRIRNIGLNVRYIFSKLDKTLGEPYYTSLVWTVRFYTEPFITVGISRNYLSGGLPTDRPFTDWDAALIVFEQLMVDTKIAKNNSQNINEQLRVTMKQGVSITDNSLIGPRIIGGYSFHP